MSTNRKKLIGVVFLCVCGIGLSIGMAIWISHIKNSKVVDHKKFTSWAMTVPIDSSKTYPVTDVIDGDTLKTNIDGHAITIRMLGINTPEVLDPRKAVECYGPEASAESKSLLTGKNILISLNPNYDRIDKYGRLLAYIYLQDVATTSTLFVNEYLVKEGYAREYTFNEKKPYQYQKLFRGDELEAKKAGKGLWSKCI